MDYQEYSLESEIQNDSDDNGSNEQLSYGLKMRAADPRYITNGDDSNRGHMLLTMAQVRELITRKEQSEEGVATVWLTTAEMCFTLTDEPNAILCPRDVRDGKVSDRYLAPAISRFAVSIQANVGTGAEIDLQTKDVWRELMSLHQRWDKVSKLTDSENIRAQACNECHLTRHTHTHTIPITMVTSSCQPPRALGSIDLIPRNHGIVGRMGIFSQNETPGS